MKNKIVGLLGVLCIIFAISAWFAYSNTIKNNSEMFGKKVLTLSRDVKSGEEITKDIIVSKRVKLNDLSSEYLTEDNLNNILGKVAAIDLHKNEQLSLSRLASSESYYPLDSRLVALDITPSGCLAGNIDEKDFVDVWSSNTATLPVKEISQIQIVAIKDSQNQDVKNVDGAIPACIILKARNDDEIAILKNITTPFICKSEIQDKIALDIYSQEDN